MRDLIKQIIKEESSGQTKLLQAIQKLGTLKTIKMVGGFKTFESLLPNYFINDERKIDLINELVEEYEEEYGDFIWFENIETDEIRYGEGEDEEGNSLVTYLVSVDTDGVGYRTYKYDSDEILDMDFEEGYLKMKYLEEDIINQIFKKLVNYFLVKDVSTPN
jgi:hypothetical protein